MRDYIELAPVTLVPTEFDHIEERIKKVFKELLYYPLLREWALSRRIINSKTKDTLATAIAQGRIQYDGGKFTGKFSAGSSKELKKLGATWKGGAFILTASKVPPEILSVLVDSDLKFKAKIEKVAESLSQKLPEEIAGRIKTADLFASTLEKTDRQLGRTLKAAVSVQPELTPQRTKKIADEWQNNMELWIQNFAEEEIKDLREKVKQSVFAGDRQDELLKIIQRSYGVTSSKAKFLARQETNLLLTKFKEVRYTEAGLSEYKWGCVAGTPNHPVRPSHKILEGKIFRWDTPPITTAPDETERRNNPGQDYNCRCFAIPLLRKSK